MRMNIFFIYILPLMHNILHKQMALVPRNTQGHGWLRPAIGVAELSQCIIQVLIFMEANLIYNFFMSY